MNPPEPHVACREVILELTNGESLLGAKGQRLLSFAKNRHGLCNSNSGSGIVYPEDLDEYQIEVEGEHIPDGWLSVFVYTDAIPPGYELLVPEDVYLRALASALLEAGCTSEAKEAHVLAEVACVQFESLKP